MILRNLFVFLSTLALLMVIGLVVMNWHSVHIFFLGHTRVVPLGALILVCTGLSSLAAVSLATTLHRDPAQEAKRLGTWQVQDAKLAAQVKSDREKQLEAKITTLESALKTALKKQ
jgi:uncharacterized integral membrane protein